MADDPGGQQRQGMLQEQGGSLPGSPFVFEAQCHDRGQAQAEMTGLISLDHDDLTKAPLSLENGLIARHNVLGTRWRPGNSAELQANAARQRHPRRHVLKGEG